MRCYGIRNVAAILWHLPFAALYAKTAPRGETSQKNVTTEAFEKLLFLSS